MLQKISKYKLRNTFFYCNNDLEYFRYQKLNLSGVLILINLQKNFINDSAKIILAIVLDSWKFVFSHQSVKKACHKYATSIVRKRGIFSYINYT